MTNAQFCWVEVGAVVPGPEGPAGPPGPGGAGHDTLFGHGTSFGTNPSPVEGEAQFDQTTGQTQSFESGVWVDHVSQDGDEYVDMDTGITYALYGPPVAASAQQTFVISEADYLANVVPAGATTGDVILSGTGGYARIL